MEKLSIITINLDNATGLKNTIESVVNQTLQKFEFIIIDGGSSDGSLEIIKHYDDKISYWISEKDEGIYNAMNKGIEYSHGEYCFFLNSGDCFVDNGLLENIFKKQIHEDMIFGNMFVCFNGKVIGKSRGIEKLTFFDIYSGSIKHQSTFIRRDLFHKFGLYDESLKIIADWEFLIKTVGLGDATYKYIDIDISYFDNNGISNNSGNLIEMERKIVLDRNIPAMMRPDYEYFSKYGKFEGLTKYRLTWLFLRFLTKAVKLFEKYSP